MVQVQCPESRVRSPRSKGPTSCVVLSSCKTVTDGLALALGLGLGFSINTKKDSQPKAQSSPVLPFLVKQFTGQDQDEKIIISHKLRRSSHP